MLSVSLDSCRVQVMHEPICELEEASTSHINMKISFLAEIAHGSTSHPSNQKEKEKKGWGKEKKKERKKVTNLRVINLGTRLPKVFSWL